MLSAQGVGDPRKLPNLSGELSLQRLTPYGEVLLYDGPQRPITSIFVLMIEGPSRVGRIDGTEVHTSGVQYHMRPGRREIVVDINHLNLMAADHGIPTRRGWSR
jgi:hypothetical protein